MDMLNKAKGALSGGGSSKPAGQSNTGAGQDYGDKGIAAAQKKFGMNSNPETNEKITDAGRGFIEKQTGKDIPDKVRLYSLSMQHGC